MKTILLFGMLLCAFHLLAQNNRDHDRVIRNTTGDDLDTFYPNSEDTKSRRFADYFMKKATLVDASGNIHVGRDEILAWSSGPDLAPEQPKDNSRKIIGSLVRLIRPDLAIVVGKSCSSNSANRNELSYNILWRRIDGKWYIETCTIVPVAAQSDTALEYLQTSTPDLTKK